MKTGHSVSREGAVSSGTRLVQRGPASLPRPCLKLSMSGYTDRCPEEGGRGWERICRLVGESEARPLECIKASVYIVHKRVMLSVEMWQISDSRLTN